MALIGDVAVSDPRAVEEFALRWGTAWNDHDGDAVTAMCAEDLV
jgi:ketosteroid isomerase-like protein